MFLARSVHEPCHPGAAVGDVVEGGRGCGGRRSGMWWKALGGDVVQGGRWRKCKCVCVCVCVCDKGVDQGYLAKVSGKCI